MSAKYKSPSFLLPNELNTSANPLNTDGDPATGTGINSLYSMDFDGNVSKRSINLGIISEINGLTSFSISLWINPFFGTPLVSQLVFGNRDVSNSYRGVAFGLGVRASYTSNFYINSSTGTTAIVIPADTFTENAWNHTVFTYDGNTAIAYVNNVNVASSSVSGATLSSTGEFFIGRGYNATNLYAKGKIDEFAIFNRALNTTEISALYDGTGSNIRPSNLMATDLNPIAYYPLGEQAQNSGYPSATGNEWQFPNGVLQDYVMDFDGSNKINLGNSIGDIGTSPMTFSFWVNFAATSQIQTVLSNINSANNNGWKIEFSATGTSILFQNRDSGKFISCSYNLYDVWTNIIIVRNGMANNKIYINGQSQTLNTNTENLTNIVSTDDLVIGSQYYNNAYYRYFNGQMSNVAIWNTAITDAAQIANIYNNGSPQTTYTVTPQNWWKLNATSVYTPSAPNYTTALDFGGSQTVNTNYTGLDGLSKATISLWVKSDSKAANSTIFNARNASNVGMNCQFFNQATYLYFTSSISIVSANYTPQPFDDKLWLNLVIVFDGTLTGNDRIKLYANGKTKVIQTYNGTIPAVLPTSSTSLALAEGLNGQLSNFAIFNSALSATQVSTLFNFGTPETAISFSPQAWWKLNDQTAITDSSGNGNTGTNNGATDISSGVAVIPSWKIPDASGTSNGVSTTLPSTALQQSDLQFDSPYSNYSLYFDGALSRVQALYNLPSGVTKFSVSIWGNVEGAGSTANKCLISNENNTSADGYALFTEGAYPNTKVFFKIENNTSTQTTSNIVFGEWFHVLGTYDNGTAKIYFNGVLEDTTTGVPAINTSSLVSTMIGSYREASPIIPMLGNLDEAAIWDTVALTDAQVLQVYNNGKPNDISSLSPTNWWRLGENAYFNNGNKIVTPNSIIGGVDGIGSGTVNDSLSANAPGTYANGIGTNLDILDRVGDAPLSTSNSQSYNMIPSDISPYVPQYVGNQIANVDSMTFNGVDEYFNTGSSTIGQLQVMSVSAWFKETQNAAANTALVANNGSTNKGWCIWIDGTNLRWQVADGSGSTSWTNTVVGSFRTYAPLNDWNHVCCTFDGVYSKIYINSVLRETWTATPTPYVVDYSGNVGNLTIGRRSYANSGFFRGQIDEVALFDTALSADQIKFDLYQPSLPLGSNKTADIAKNPNLPTPVAWYRMGD